MLIKELADPPPVTESSDADGCAKAGETTKATLTPSTHARTLRMCASQDLGSAIEVPHEPRGVNARA
jgi:hypothetical protein